MCQVENVFKLKNKIRGWKKLISYKLSEVTYYEDKKKKTIRIYCCIEKKYFIQTSYKLLEWFKT